MGSERARLAAAFALLCAACDPAAGGRALAPLKPGGADPADPTAPADTGGPDGVDSGGAAGADGGGADDPPDDDPAAPALTFLSPADGATVDNPVTFTLAAPGVARVALSADGWAMAEGAPVEGTWTVTYTFSGTGTPRAVLAEGFDAGGAPVASAGITLTVRPDPPEGVSLDVPYFYQYDNRYEPGSTCGITSAAMVLAWWAGAGAPTPDELYVQYGKAQGQSPGGLEALYEAEGLYGAHTYGGTRAQIRAHLDAGRPVVVHGDWTGAGHIAVIVGYDDDDWIVNDPAGDWEVCYGCGGGEGVRYAHGGAWDDAMSHDGDVWLSVADLRPL